MFKFKNKIISGLLLGAILLAPREGEVRTWYVKADSTGDVPTLRSAVQDSAAAGDTVLVGPGTYVIEACIDLNNSITIVSESGPTATRITAATPPYYFPNCAFYIELLRDARTEISGFWFDDFDPHLSRGCLICIALSDSVFVHHNVFTDHLGTAIDIFEGPCSYVFIENNTFTSGSFAIRNNAGYIPGMVRYNIIRSELEGMSFFWVGCNCVLDSFYVNFEADPQFCGTIESGNLYIQSDSPCAPGNDPYEAYCDSVLIGALPVGCGTTPVRRATWGHIKSLYR
jgi:hypothetical protein